MTINNLEKIKKVFKEHKIETRYFTNVKVSTSGLARTFNIYVMIDNEPHSLQHVLFEYENWGKDVKAFNKKTNLGFNTAQEFIVKGCGMDMLSHTTSLIAYAIFESRNDKLTYKVL